MNLFFARHGQTDWNILRKVQGTTDIPLNAEGIRQAESLAQEIISEGIELKRIYTSYQKRAVETAKIVGDRLGLECQVMAGLEEMNLGAFEGHTWSEIEQLYPAELNEWISNKRYNRAPGGESYQMVLERLFASLDKIVDIESKERDENILIVSHGAVIMTLIAIKNNVPFEEAYKIDIENAKPILITKEELIEIRKKALKVQKKHYCYMVRCKDNSLYSGYTTDLERRVWEHNNSDKGAKYTRTRRPCVLAYYEEYADRSTAMKREAELKKLGKLEKERLVADFH